MKIRGISFPFRVGVKGGVVMSEASSTSVAHMVESIQQILLTRPMERSMSFEIYSDIDAEIFSPNDTSSHTLLEYQVRKAIEYLEPRVVVSSVQVSSDEENKVIAHIVFSMTQFEGAYTTDVEVGDSYVE